MHDPLAISFTERLKSRPILSLFLIGIIGLAIVAGWQISEAEPIEPKLVEATITGFGTRASYTGSEPLANLTFEDGNAITLALPLALVETCKVGNVVTLERRGINHQFTPNGCRQSGSDEQVSSNSPD